MSRFAWADPSMHTIRPRFDPVGGQRRLDPYGPAPVLATLEGRPVFLVRPDPATRRPGVPATLTVPYTVARMRRQFDIERGRAVDPYEPTPLDVPLSFPFAGPGPLDAPMQLLTGTLVGGVLAALTSLAIKNVGARNAFVMGAVAGAGATLVQRERMVA